MVHDNPQEVGIMDVHQPKPKEVEAFGSWMLVKKPQRKRIMRSDKAGASANNHGQVAQLAQEVAGKVGANSSNAAKAVATKIQGPKRELVQDFKFYVRILWMKIGMNI